MTTSRIGMNGESSMAYGADGVFKLFGEDYLETRIAQTSNTLSTAPYSFKDNSMVYLKWERRNEKGFAYDLNYSYSGLEFNPSAGFMEKLGTAGIDLRTQYGWLPGEQSFVRTFKLMSGYSYIKRLIDDGLEMSSLGLGADLSTKSGWMFMSMLESMKEGVMGEFHLGPNAMVPAGEYNQLRLMSMVSTPYSKPVVMDVEFFGGDFFDGSIVSASARPTLNLSSSLQFSGSYSYNRIRFDQRNQQFDSHIAQIKALYMLSTKLSVSSFLQYNSVNSVFVGNFRLRYNPLEGNDFFLVYNETRPSSDYPFDSSNRVNFLNRMILLKYVYTFKI